MNENEKSEIEHSIYLDKDNKTLQDNERKQLPKKFSKNKQLMEQRNKTKIELINKHNMSEEEAEKTLQELEKKVMKKNTQNWTHEQETKEEREGLKTQIQKSSKPKRNSEKEKIREFIESENDDIIIPIHKGNQEKGQTETVNRPEENRELNEEEKEKPQNTEDKTEQQDAQKKNGEKKKHKNVDQLISSIIPEEEKVLSIEVKNVSLSFEVATEKIDNLKELFIRTLKRNKGNVTKFQALKDITFNIYKGEKIGIIGYNGAGKSTLLNVITGIYPPDTGEVKTYGQISPLLALGAGFDHNYSGRENIYLNGAIMGYSKKFLESKYDEIVEFSELEQFIDFPVKNYSSGMLAKLGFSIATIVEPDILIIDEVLGVGDVNFQKKSSDKIRSLMDKGTTVLLVSHSIPQIRKLCEKAIWIDKGQVREIGEVNEVCNHYLKDAEKASKDQLKDIRFK